MRQRRERSRRELWQYRSCRATELFFARRRGRGHGRGVRVVAIPQQQVRVGVSVGKRLVLFFHHAANDHKVDLNQQGGEGQDTTTRK